MPLPDIDPGRRENLYRAVAYICDTFGIEYTEDTAEQMLVFLEALRIYSERTKQYGFIWKEAGALEALFNAHRKSRRMFKRISGLPEGYETALEPNVDDALDAMNYLVFGIRSLRVGQIHEDEGEEGYRHKYIDDGSGFCTVCDEEKRSMLHEG